MYVPTEYDRTMRWLAESKAAFSAGELREFDARVRKLLGKEPSEVNVIVLHLGNGSSMCALAAGKSVTSTMGFSALEGVPMGTRCGSLDPGVILFLLDQRKMDVRAKVEKLGLKTYTQTIETDAGKQAREIILDGIPMRRIGEEDEIKGLAVYLASAAAYVTGSTYCMDGGMTNWNKGL